MNDKDQNNSGEKQKHLSLRTVKGENPDELQAMMSTFTEAYPIAMKTVFAQSDNIPDALRMTVKTIDVLIGAIEAETKKLEIDKADGAINASEATRRERQIVINASALVAACFAANQRAMFQNKVTRMAGEVAKQLDYAMAQAGSAGIEANSIKFSVSLEPIDGDASKGYGIKLDAKIKTKSREEAERLAKAMDDGEEGTHCEIKEVTPEINELPESDETDPMTEDDPFYKRVMDGLSGDKPEGDADENK